MGPNTQQTTTHKPQDTTMSKSKSNGETTPKEYREKSNVNQKPNKDFTNLPEILHKANNEIYELLYITKIHTQ